MKKISWVVLFFYLGLTSCMSYRPFYVKTSQQEQTLPILDPKHNYRIVLDNGQKVKTAWKSVEVTSDQILVKASRSSQEPTIIPVMQVSRIDRAKIDPLKTSLLVGGVAGVIVTIIVGALIVNGLSDVACEGGRC